MDALDISNARSKIVPDILQRGCRIETAHGGIDIGPDWALRIALLVDLYLVSQQPAQERKQ